MLSVIRPYMPLIITSLWLIALWRCGNWKNLKNYYPSILFLTVVSLTVFLLTYNYPLWKFHSTFLFPNRTIQELRIDFLILPSVCFLFLTFYRYTSIIQQFIYISFWAVLLSALEIPLVKANIITYHNGWNIWWTVVLWFISLPVIRLHYSRPFWAWLATLLLTVLSIVYFEIPVGKLN